METNVCPNCGHQAAPDVNCPNCGRHARNGNVPAEVSGWAVEPTPPDLLAWARQTFDEAAYLEALREVERAGGVKFEDFIGEIERIAHGAE